MKRTATTSHALLGLLSLREEWSTNDLIKQMRRNLRFFWPRVESRIYDEARAVVDAGLATAKHEYTGRRRRTMYSITEEGRRSVSAWLETPPNPTRLECEPLLRIFMADFSTREQLQAAIDRIRADAEAIQSAGRTVGEEYLSGTAPFQDQLHVRGLVFDFLWSHAEMLRQWADRTELSMDAWKEASEANRAEAAAAVIRRHLQGDAEPKPQLASG